MTSYFIRCYGDTSVGKALELLTYMQNMGMVTRVYNNSTREETGRSQELPRTASFVVSESQS